MILAPKLFIKAVNVCLGLQTKSSKTMAINKKIHLQTFLCVKDMVLCVTMCGSNSDRTKTKKLLLGKAPCTYYIIKK